MKSGHLDSAMFAGWYSSSSSCTSATSAAYYLFSGVYWWKMNTTEEVFLVLMKAFSVFEHVVNDNCNILSTCKHTCCHFVRSDEELLLKVKVKLIHLRQQKYFRFEVSGFRLKRSQGCKIFWIESLLTRMFWSTSRWRGSIWKPAASYCVFIVGKLWREKAAVRSFSLFVLRWSN